METDSVNVGLPQESNLGGKSVRTSIWKYPVQGRVHVSTLNLDGDQQSDLSVHGGVDKAVYLYSGNTIPTGELSCLMSICRGVRPVRISPVTVFWRIK